MDQDSAREYSESLGQITEGWWRQIAWAFGQDIPQALGMSRRAWAETYHGHLRMPIEERKEAIAELAAGGMSDRAIADAIGIDKRTVGRDRGADAPLENPEPQISDEMPGANAPPSTRDLLSQSDQNDWRTPRKYLEAARMVLGAIDLDPASGAEANETVQAARFYTEADDGLQQPWKGRIWLNPPYGGQARLFIERLIREYQVGNVLAAVALVNSHPTETKWFQELFRYTICFAAGRIDFGGPSREVASTSTHGSAFVYLGNQVDLFRAQFGQFGAVVRAL